MIPHRLLLLLALVCVFQPCRAQILDGAFAFGVEPAKAYSLYVPSGYDPARPVPTMIAFHPLNTARWNSVSWRDTLIAFAEQNSLLLVCPDGGPDGAVDDPIDTAFTSALLDSVRVWYNVDRSRTYAMGFSWGGRTTYTYGLSHPGVFGGLLPIGAAINGVEEVPPSLRSNAIRLPIFIIHGSADNPATRYTPVKTALESAGAVVRGMVLSGVGHTIDFPDRERILTEGFRWIDSVNLAGRIPQGIEPSDDADMRDMIDIYPNPVRRGASFRIGGEWARREGIVPEVFDLTGRSVAVEAPHNPGGNGAPIYQIGDVPAGMYVVNIVTGGVEVARTLIVVP